MARTEEYSDGAGGCQPVPELLAHELNKSYRVSTRFDHSAGQMYPFAITR